MDDVHPLRVWRDRNGVTLATLAGAVGVTPSHLSEIERGLDAPSLGLADRLTKATGGTVSISEFVRVEAAE